MTDDVMTEEGMANAGKVRTLQALQFAALIAVNVPLVWLWRHFERVSRVVYSDLNLPPDMHPWRGLPVMSGHMAPFLAIVLSAVALVMVLSSRPTARRMQVWFALIVLAELAVSALHATAVIGLFVTALQVPRG